MMRGHWSDRIAGAILLALAVSMWVVSGNYAVSFGDPGGPTLFPRMIAVPMGLLSLYLIIRPDRDPVWLVYPAVLRQIGILAVLFGYPLAIEPLGFPTATFLAVVPISLLFGASWLQAVLSGLGLGLGLYLLFDKLFGLPLPAGPIFG